MVMCKTATEREHPLATSSVPKQCDSTAAAVARSRFPVGQAAVVAVAICALGLLWEFRRPWFQGNLGVVDPGKVMRSAQPTSQLPTWVRDFQIKSILNLRGGSPADWWYDAEVRIAEESGLAYYDLPLSATRRPTRRELLVLIDILERCPYPLLIHCKSGADRTGLASALYLMLARAEPPDQAEGAFSIEFGHVPLGGTEHLHEPLREYAAWLKANRLPHTAERFRSWVKKDYRAADPPADPPVWQTGPRARRS
jgi:protein tyrosine phosphatase (PTP) superfamily phosphohydrolase (DUF442 family)